MERRSFLTTATLGTAGLSTFLTTGCANINDDVVLVVNGVQDFELDEETILSLQKKIKSGAYTAEK